MLYVLHILFFKPYFILGFFFLFGLTAYILELCGFVCFFVAVLLLLLLLKLLF